MVGHKWIIEQENGERFIGTTEYFPKGYDEKTIIGKTLEILPLGWFPSRRIGKVVEYLGTVVEYLGTVVEYLGTTGKE